MLLLLLLLLAAKILLTSLDLSLHLQHNDMVGGGRGLSKVKDKKSKPTAMQNLKRQSQSDSNKGPLAPRMLVMEYGYKYHI